MATIIKTCILFCMFLPAAKIPPGAVDESFVEGRSEDVFRVEGFVRLGVEICR